MFQFQHIKKIQVVNISFLLLSNIIMTHLLQNYLAWGRSIKSTVIVALPNFITKADDNFVWPLAAFLYLLTQLSLPLDI